MLEKGCIPPNANLESIKKELKFNEQVIAVCTCHNYELRNSPDSGHQIPRSLTEWPGPSATIRRASVNSFGYGGTNAHAVLEQAPQRSILHLANGTYTGTLTSYELIENKKSTPMLNGHSSNGNFPNGHSLNGHSLTNEYQPKYKESYTNGTLALETSHGKSCQPGLVGSDGSVIRSVHHMSSRLLVMSAHSQSSLKHTVSNLAEWALALTDGDAQVFEDLAYTLSTRRSLMTWRCSLVAADFSDLTLKLRQASLRCIKASSNVQPIFVFTGQGSQWHAMGRELSYQSMKYRQSLYLSDSVLRSLGAEWSLLNELAKDERDSRINEGRLAQPSTTALQIALVDLLQSVGIFPTVVVGHSSGEIAAAYAAGVLTQSEALKVAYHRGYTSELSANATATRGAMLAVGLGESQCMAHVAQVQTGQISIACVNSPSSVTVSGDEAGIDVLKNRLDKASVFNRKLLVDTAYHSHHMQAIAQAYERSLQELVWQDPKEGVRFVSTVTASRKLSGFGPSYWTENLVSTVRFSDAIEVICRTSMNSKMSNVTAGLIEIGPHSALSGPIRQIINGLELPAFDHFYAPTLTRKQNAIHTFLELASTLHNHGLRVDLDQVNNLDGLPREQQVLIDLPHYPWNLTTSFWHESHLSKEHRLRAHPWHDLLGVRTPGSTIRQPTWRNLVTLDTLPWLRDHVVDDLVVLPGAAYLCSAIEAVHQISFERGTFSSIRRVVLKDVNFSKALVIPEPPNRLELKLSLRSSQANLEYNTTAWETFQVECRTADGKWHSHCHGLVKVEYDQPADEIEMDREERLTVEQEKVKLCQKKLHCAENMDIKDLYSTLQENGNDYRSAFSILEELRIGSCEALGIVRIPTIAERMPSGFMQPHVIHPATLDSLFHINIPLFHRNCAIGPAVPVSIGELVISTRVANKPGDELLLTSELIPRGSRTASVNVTAFQRDAGQETPVLTMKGCELRGIGEARAGLTPTTELTNMVHRPVWGPEIGSLNDKQVRIMSENLGSDDSLMSPEQRSTTLNLAASYYINACLKQLASNGTQLSEKHYKYLVDWMNRYVNSADCRRYLADSSGSETTNALQELHSVGAQGEMLARTGERLSLILAGELDPLSLMLDDGLLYRVYAEDSALQSCAHLATFVKNLLFQKPYLTVLEVGAGTGGTTLPLLQALSRDSRLLLHRYDFTDVSSGFFEPAKALLEKWSAVIDYKKLNIEEDPINQGFEAYSYDLVIASNVLHATAPLERTISHVRKLLKPGGRLAMIEATKLPPYVNIIFGLLPGWWKSFGEGHVDGPLRSADEWNVILQQNSFTGTDIVVKDYEDSAHKCSLLISQTKAETQTSLSPVDICYFGDEDLGEELEHTLRERDYNCSQYSQTSQVSSEKIYIVLDSGNKSILENPSDQQFRLVASLLNQARRVLWLSLPKGLSSASSPGWNLFGGVARVARAENKTLELVTAKLSSKSGDRSQELFKVILDLLDKSFGDDTPTAELEYYWDGDELQVARLVAEPSIEALINSSDHLSQPSASDFVQQTRPLKLSVASPGLLDSMVFVEDELAQRDLEVDELEIEAKAFGINFKDVFIALGQMNNQQMTGECGGVVTRVGSDMRSRYNIGDRVCGWRATAYASYPRLKGTNVHHIPEDMSFETAASLPVVYLTAYYSLVEVARIGKGDKVLIHAASGGVGQAAIQIAQSFEAEIFATVGSASKRQLIMNRYSLPESHIFSSKCNTFKQGIMRLTGGHGVDIILNSLSGDHLQDSWDCIATFGTFVEIGKTDIYRNSQMDMKPFDRNVNFSSVDLTLLADRRGQVMQRLFGELMAMFRDGRLTPVHPLTIMPIGEIESAFRLIQARKHVGKIVLNVDEGASVKATASKPEFLGLDSRATYIVAGGLGSLGGYIVRFMIEHGAKHVVVLSRRDLDAQEQDDYARMVRANDAEVRVMACDITNVISVQETLGWIKRNMPRIKGVVQAAMVLQDALLEQMSTEAYKRALHPKMLGTQNLVEALCDTTFDFFIMLSSASSVLGFIGQANYAAGCAWQDALAQSRAHSNAHYVSLNLGMVEETDIIALHPEVQQALLRAGCIPIKVQQVLKLLEYSMSLQARKDGSRQISIGFNKDSLSTPTALSVLKNPLFSLLPSSSHIEKAQSSAQTQLDVSGALVGASSSEEIHKIIASAIGKKMSALISLGEQEIAVDCAISNLGLDSLIAIELKNWIVQTFHSPLQSSEILDSPTIKVLAETVAARSTVLSSRTNEPATITDDAGANQLTPLKEARLPTMPLPDLADSFDQYVESVRRFCSKEDMQSLADAIEEFHRPNSLAQTLHRRLVERNEDPGLDDWLYDLYQVETWTKRRVPLNPWGHFFGAYPDGGIYHGQARRAAIITEAALRFKERLEAGRIDRDYMNEDPLDMTLHQWTFNSHLEPGVGNDKIQQAGADDCVFVLRNGHIFKIVSDTMHSSVNMLETEFEAILEASDNHLPSIACLMADTRDSWAEVRELVKRTDHRNEDLLQQIETAAFVICLDDESPETPSERLNRFLLGGPSNRWSDKSLQFVICRNGASAVIGEHAMLDGDTLNQLHRAVIDAIQSDKPDTQPQTNGYSHRPAHAPEEHRFVISPAIQAHIDRAHDLFYADFVPYEYTHHTYRAFGGSFLRTHRCAPKTVFQIAIQLAGGLYFGDFHPCLEPVSMRPFHRGRLDFVQTTIPPVYDFLTAAAEAIRISEREQQQQQQQQGETSVDKPTTTTTPAHTPRPHSPISSLPTPALPPTSTPPIQATTQPHPTLPAPLSTCSPSQTSLHGYTSLSPKKCPLLPSSHHFSSWHGSEDARAHRHLLSRHR